MQAILCGQILINPRAPRTDRHILSGTIKTEGLPSPMRRLALFQRWPLVLLAVTRSKKDGSFRFSGLPEYPERSLKIVGYDDDRDPKYNAECLDYLTQVAAPDPGAP